MRAAICSGFPMVLPPVDGWPPPATPRWHSLDSWLLNASL